jgi:hypothetical protein
MEREDPPIGEPDLSLLFALMGQSSKSAADCTRQTTTLQAQRQRDRMQAAQCIAKLLVAPMVVQVLGAQLKLLATDEASLSVSILERMPPSWTSSEALSLATTCSREEEDQWLLEFVHAVVAWLRSKGKPPQSPDPAQPQGLIPTFLSALFPLAARYVEKTVLHAPTR